MEIADAQREVRTRLVAARAAITTLVVGGFFIFPVTELLLRVVGGKGPLSPQNSLHDLGMQVAFVLALSMPLLLPVGLYRLNWFYPATMILLGAHYLPFVFLYGMRMFAVLAALVSGGGMIIAMYLAGGFSVGAWYTGAILALFAGVGGAVIRQEARGAPAGSRMRHGYL